MGSSDVEAFLTHLAVEDHVSASTQNQALQALLFLYRQVLEIELPWLENVTRARRPKRLPVVLTVAEVRSVLVQLDGAAWLFANLFYDSGLRLRFVFPVNSYACARAYSVVPRPPLFRVSPSAAILSAILVFSH